MQFSTNPKLLRPPKLSEQVAQFLSDEIAKGILKTGENLPSESELASQFDVSRTIIREAIARLENDRIWEQIRGDQDQRDPIADKKAILETHSEHRSIFDAIAKGDYEKAGKAVIEHISNAAKRRNIKIDL